MPSISNRGNAMPASPIRKLMPYANNAKAAGKSVFHLNIGQPDIATPTSIIDAVKQSSLTTLAYSPSEGFASYRSALSDYYSKHSINVTADEIIITTGGSEAISFAMMACLNEGDEIIIPEPFYANYNGFSTASGVKVVPIASNIQDNFALPKIEAFEQVITNRTKAIMICNPNNPTGYLYSEEELMQLKDLCLKHDLYLFSDEAYREFCYDGKKHISPLSIEGLEEHAILLDTISKRYSACGARIGALVTKNKAVLNTVMKFAQARLSPPTFEQILGEAACALPDSFFEPILNEYKKRRDTLVNRLQAMPGVICPNPGGAFYCMAQLPIEDAEDFCIWLLEHFEINNETLMVAPASGFYADNQKGQNEIRLAYVLNTNDIHKAMDILEQGLVAYQSKKV